MRARTQAVLSSGLVLGLVGYASVVVFGAILDVLIGRPLFFTPALFGSVLFYGLDEPFVVEIAAGPVLAYNAAHLAMFLGLGMFASWLVAIAERYPTAQYFLFVLLIIVAAHVYAALLLFGVPLLGHGAWWQLGASSVVAALLMGWYVWKEHPVLRRGLREIPMGDVPEIP